MSLHDKQHIWKGRPIASKNGGPWHLITTTAAAMCGQALGRSGWRVTFGPVAPYRTCERCRTAGGNP